MANPQIENGYLKIANEVWERMIISGMTAGEFPVVMAVIRQSWGWKKKEAAISLLEFQEITRQPRTSIARALRSLIVKKILKKVSGGGRGNASKWAFNKDWELWQTVPPAAQIKTVPRMAQISINSATSGTQTVPPAAQIKTTNGTVSTCNSLLPKKQLSPKDIFKESKEKTASQSPEKDAPKTAHPPDPAYEEFAKEFKTKRTIPYRHKTADFVHLAALRRALDIGTKETPMKWRKAIGNYFASTLSAYTLADLCQRYDCFINGRMDRFGKPAPEEEKTLYDYDESRPK